MFPHTCECGSPCYRGITKVECVNPMCRHYTLDSGEKSKREIFDPVKSGKIVPPIVVNFNRIAAHDVVPADMALPPHGEINLPDGRVLGIEQWSPVVEAERPLTVRAKCHVIRPNGDLAQSSDINHGDIKFPDSGNIDIGGGRVFRFFKSWCSQMIVEKPVRLSFEAYVEKKETP